MHALKHEYLPTTLTWTQTHTNTSSNTHTPICSHTHTHMHAYIHTHIYTYTHTHTQTNPHSTTYPPTHEYKDILPMDLIFKKTWPWSVCCSVLQCVAVCCSVLQCVVYQPMNTKTQSSWATQKKHKYTFTYRNISICQDKKKLAKI